MSGAAVVVAFVVAAVVCGAGLRPAAVARSGARRRTGRLAQRASGQPGSVVEPLLDQALAHLERWPVAARGATQWRTTRDRVAVERSLPSALDGVARSLRSGRSLHQALTDPARAADGVRGPAALGLASVAASVQAGVALPDAAQVWAARVGGECAPLAAAALALASRLGGPQARAIEVAARSVRERLAARGEVAAHSAQARASVGVLAGLPIVVLVASALTDARITRWLVTTAPGWGCLAGGLALDGLGAWWMARLMVAARSA